jgi:hypothetical protein
MKKTVKPTFLSPKEELILKKLLAVHKKNANLYLDLALSITDWAPKEIKKWVHLLQDKELIQYLPSQDETHCLCLITAQGIAALGASPIPKQFELMHTYLVALVLLLVGVMAYGMLSIKNPSKTHADVTGVGITPATKAILTNWIENKEGENSDNYTFDLLEENEGRKTYFVECKMDHLSACKYNVVFVEVDENKGVITNVQVAQD